MSHSVKVTLIADREIEMFGMTVNIHDLQSIRVDGKGRLVDFDVRPEYDRSATDKEDNNEQIALIWTAIWELRSRMLLHSH